jgi:hypothetical protein
MAASRKQPAAYLAACWPDQVTAIAPDGLLFPGGEPMDGGRHIWWNFLSS